MKKLIIKIIEGIGIHVQLMSKIRHSEAKQFLWVGRYDVNYIFDVGANEGQFMQKILPLFPEANYIFFEPVKEAYDKLVQGLASYQGVGKNIDGYPIVLR